MPEDIMTVLARLLCQPKYRGLQHLLQQHVRIGWGTDGLDGRAALMRASEPLRQWFLARPAPVLSTDGADRSKPPRENARLKEEWS